MHILSQILKCAEDEKGSYLLVFIPRLRLKNLIKRKEIRQTELRFDDGRHISADQRRKTYATIRDISEHTGNYPEAEKELLKWWHMETTGDGYFSLSNCSMDMARRFINTIMEYAIKEGIPLSERGIERTDDTGRYLYYCLVHKKCAVCGKDGEIHHVDTIGMGNDRRKVDDSNYRKICLCRTHHTIAHQKGVVDFCKAYKVYGIVIKDFEG